MDIDSDELIPWVTAGLLSDILGVTPAAGYALLVDRAAPMTAPSVPRPGL